MSTETNNTPQAPATLAGLYELVQIIESTLSLAHEQNPENEPLGLAWDLAIGGLDDAFDLLHSAGMPQGEPPIDRPSTPDELAITQQIEQAAETSPGADHMLAASGELVAMLARSQNLSSWQHALIVGFLGMWWKNYGAPDVLVRMAPGGNA